jgi:hypothetical protein
MPQPLKPPYELNIDPMTLADRPELAAQIGIIAALWARVEMWLGVILGDLIGTEPRFGLAMYFAIVSTSARMDTLAAVVAERPMSVNPNKFEALIKKVRACARERNRIVHANWGISLKHPNAIIAVSTDDQIRFLHIDSIYPPHWPESREQWDRSIQESLKPMMYRMADFRQTQMRLSKLIDDLQAFRMQPA